MNYKYLGSIGRAHCNQCKTGHLHLRTQLLHILLMYVGVFVCLFYKVWQFVTEMRYSESLFLFLCSIQMIARPFRPDCCCLHSR